MKIAVYGCGAMGTILGAYLTKNGYDVDMVDINKPHIAALREKGATILGYGNFTTPVHAIFPEEMANAYDLIILLTKRTANPVVLPFLKTKLSEKGVVCTMQNGVPEPSVAEIIGADKTIGGAIKWAATFVEPGVSKVTTNLDRKVEQHSSFFDIGEVSGFITPRIKQVADILSCMGYTQIFDRLTDARWTKLVVNSCCSGMSASLGCTFGEATTNPRSLDCVRGIAYEVAVVSMAAGVHIDPPYLQLLLREKDCKTYFHNHYLTGGNGKASMLQDLEAGRLTEVDMLNGQVCKTGRELGIPTPYNDTVVKIVHDIEAGKLPLSTDNLRFFPEIHYEDRILEGFDNRNAIRDEV